MSQSDAGLSERPEGFKAMPGNCRFVVGFLWFYCGVLAILFVITLSMTGPEAVSSGWSTTTARGLGFAAVFAGLAFAHGFLAVGLTRRNRLARLGAVAFQWAVVAGYLYLAVDSVITDFAGSLENLGGLLCGVALAVVVALNLHTSEMRTWCDR